MSTFRSITPEAWQDNPFRTIGDDWMLITAGTPSHCNTMTASWGGVGILWNKPVAFAFVRPQRYTYEFLEKQDTFSLSVLPREYRNALQFCGSRSGRDTDKFKETGLTVRDEDGIPCIEQARLILLCKTVYKQDMTAESFCDESLFSHYKANDFHRQYVGEILKVLVK